MPTHIRLEPTVFTINQRTNERVPTPATQWSVRWDDDAREFHQRTFKTKDQAQRFWVELFKKPTGTPEQRPANLTRPLQLRERKARVDAMSKGVRTTIVKNNKRRGGGPLDLYLARAHASRLHGQGQ
jgi:hypothetical protein